MLRAFSKCSVLNTMIVMIIIMFVSTDPADDSLVTATVPAVDGFGWTTFSAVARNQVSQTVNTTSGAFTPVDTAKMSRSRAIRVMLQTNGLRFKTFCV